jgi:type I restriction-modification system DNA methylase subunit
MSKKQAEINRDVRSFLVKADLEKRSSFSKDDVDFLNSYTGSGGLASKGETGRGLLYEYYTPEALISAMWTEVIKLGFKSGKILEPSCGTGRFLKYISPHGENVVDAYEFNKDDDTGYKVASITYPWANIKYAPFESHFYNSKDRPIEPVEEYDLVIGNPPYGKFSGFYSSNKREGKRFIGHTYDQYFIWRGIQVLKPGGLCAMIVPSTLVDNDSKYLDFKEQILSISTIEKGFRVPSGVFGTTQIQTDILIFRKK